MNNVKSHLFRYNNICIDFAMNDDAREFCDKKALSHRSYACIFNIHTYISLYASVCICILIFVVLIFFFFIFYLFATIVEQLILRRPRIIQNLSLA